VLKESELDELVAPMLFWKFEMGLFDDPYVDPDEAERVVGCDAHRELALTAAHEAITLLKNENNIAPLDLGKIKTIAVIGPNANRSLLGGYSGVPKHNVTVLDGIKEKAGKKVKVLYSEGCKITIGGSWNQDEVVASDPEEDRKADCRSRTRWRKADVIVLAIGGNEQTSREAWALNHMGDRTSLDLIGRQEELVKAMVALGKPVVAFLFNGRPLSINYVSQNVPVIYECWYLGQETGRAVADVLFGDYNPGGKLPITIPRSAGHLPVFYNYKPSARRGYLFDDVSPLYAFGYGLSYTSFAIENNGCPKRRSSRDGSTQVLVDVTNTGKRAGQRSGADVHPRPGQFGDAAGQGTQGIPQGQLNPAKARPSRSTSRPVALLLRREHEVCRGAGDFEIMVGNSSRDADLQKLILQVTKASRKRTAKGDERYNEQRETLLFGEKFGYGLGDMAANFVFQAMMALQLDFYTDTFGLTPAQAGTMFLVVGLGAAASIRSWASSPTAPTRAGAGSVPGCCGRRCPSASSAF
jgi:beta-glucosidase